MKQVAILGLSHFGKSVLDELINLNVDVFIIDKNREVIDTYKDSAAGAVVIDILNIENLQKVLPEGIDAVVIDMGDRIEASILAASYCSKLKMKTIIVKAETEAHAEILELVGATKIIFPSKEAAKRVTPLLLSDVLLNYFPINESISIVEIELPKFMIGKTVLDSELRSKYNLNLIAVRQSETKFQQFSVAYRFKIGDIALLSGDNKSLDDFSGDVFTQKEHRKISEKFHEFFGRKKHE
jgi:trk system potassium uptake protein TrkA